MKRLEVIIPAYNEEKKLPTLLERVIEAAGQNGFSETDFGLLLVDNGSTDKSNEVLQSVIAEKSWQNWVRVVGVAVNRGYGYGVMSGLRESTADLIAWTHADLQCDPKNIFTAHKVFIDQNRRDILVKGWRVGRALRERVVSHIFAFFARFILGLKTQELNAQPKLFPRELLEHLKSPPDDFSLDLYLLYQAQKAGYQVVAFDVKFPPRIHGTSKWAAHFLSRYKTILKTILYMFRLRVSEGRA